MADPANKSNDPKLVHGDPLVLKSRRPQEPVIAAEATMALDITKVVLRMGGKELGEINFLPERVVERTVSVLHDGTKALDVDPKQPGANNKLIELRPVPADEKK